ncbi:carbohydrate ABC transporter permease [Microbacterium rhizosphaerae]|uniref:Carbohydrate ABC transporter permease n=1 Tax=Microbacterium rhizosphaerae TaxID=1678237 RepID=A0ABZ0SLK6_9MICO|nr:carbohydrate ABC transporter permease [Microbacterium rhizosphaerae]WPR89710.1 carbohydrate ABC transporter permease [Microbacterium rhizosphaerae]
MATITASPTHASAVRGRAVRSMERSRNPFRILGAILLALVFAFPIVWTTIGAFKPATEANASPPVWWPSRFSLENFAKLDSSGSSLLGYVLNSTAVTLMTVAITTVAAVLAGYAFARFRFPGKNVLFGVSIGMLLVPYPALLVSLFTVMVWLHLTNSLIGLALIYSTFQLPFAIYMMRNSFESLPVELTEAAELDGCTKLTALPRVLLRLVAPGVVTVALFAFLAAWNEFMAALVLLNDNSSFTLPIALMNAQNGPLNTIDWGGLEAGITVTMLPCIIIFILLQRYYVSGLVAGTGK